MFVVNYHNVLDGPLDAFDRRSLRIPSAEFREEMRVLRDRFHPVPLDTLLEMARGGRPDPQAVAVTFDDGYAGVLRHGLPIMRAQGIVATMFVITNVLGDDPAPLQLHDELEMAFRLTRARVLRLSSFGYPDQSLETEADRVRCMLAVKGVMKAAREDLRRLAHRVVLERLGVSAGQCRLAALEDRHRMLDAGGLQQLLDAGWTVGSHSRSHRTLGALGEDEMRAEAVASREDLERALGRAVTLFAYPYGGAAHVGDVAPRIVAESGYRYAFTAEPGRVEAGTDWYRIPRVSFGELIELAG